MKYPLPEGEEQRLTTLRHYSVLDTAPEQAFDDLALLAAQICQVPTAMVSFVDEQRQWFKSRHGMEVSETPREIAFCAHTILNSNAVLEVPDATLDSRFASNVLVTSEPHVRFYAGAPLVAPDGQSLGALCVMDRTPRHLSEGQIAALRALSRQVVAQLELRRQACELADEVAGHRQTEKRLQAQFDQLTVSERNLNQSLITAEKSRRAVLSVLEDEKQAGQRLRQSEEKFRQLAENINEVFWISDPVKHSILYVSPRYEEVWGRTCESLYANPNQWFEAICEEDRAGVRTAMALQVRDGYHEVYRIRRPNGTERWIRDRAFPVRDSSGAVYRIVGTAEDITESKRIEEALLASEEHFRFLNDLAEATRALADPAQIMAVLTRMLGRRLRASRCAYATVEKDGEHFTILHDYTDGCESTVGKYRLSLFGPRAVALLNAGQMLVIRDVAAELRGDEGAEMFRAIGIEAIITFPLVKDGELRAMMAVHQTASRDWRPFEIALVQEVVERCWATIERRSAEDALQASEKRFKTLFEQAAVGVAQLDVETLKFVHVNQRFCVLAGRTRQELMHLTFEVLSHSQDRERGRSVDLMRQLKQGKLREFTLEKRFQQKDGVEVWAMITVSAMWAEGEIPDCCIAVVQDITTQKHLEVQFQQAQKMEAIGTLAGGIAHDFNNVLAAIVGYTDLARMSSQGNAEVLEYLKAVADGSKRATDLVRQILAFSRRQDQQRAPIKLWPVVEEALQLLRATIPATIRFDTSIDRNGPPVLADSTQVHQVIMNLATNAAHAMDGTGRLGVSLENVEVDAALVSLHPGLRLGIYQRLGVSDTGHGMDPATLSRIFEPFFTTKGPGEGTGLGLAVVHGIMQGHDGIVTVYSRPGEGTQFHLYFPVQSGESAEEESEMREVPRGRGERILLVDDEAALAHLGRKILENLGYKVEAHTVATDAIDAVMREQGRYDLVVTDLTMPGMTGLDLAKRLHAVRPELPVVLTTGYSAALTLERVQALGIRELLMKPLTIRGLGEAVNRVLAYRKSI